MGSGGSAGLGEGLVVQREQGALQPDHRAPTHLGWGPGHSIREEVGWYLPVSVVDEEGHSGSGVRVIVRVRGSVAVVRTTKAYLQAVGSGARQGRVVPAHNEDTTAGGDTSNRGAGWGRWRGGGVGGRTRTEKGRKDPSRKAKR